MPSSVLLAIVVGVGVLALLPAMIRRYDGVVRGQAELRSSSMRVLLRRRRQRTVPGTTPVRPPSSVLLAVGAEGPRGLLARDALAAHDATRIRVRRGTIGGARGARPVPVSAVPVSVRPVTAAPISAIPASVPVNPVSAVPVMRPVQVRGRPVGAGSGSGQRMRRRRMLFVLTTMLTIQAIGATVWPMVWFSLAATAVGATYSVLRLRAAAAAERRRQLAARARQHRAEVFVRRAVRAARPELVDWLGRDALREASAWLATSRTARRRPARDVVRVLSAAGRETYRAADGAWAVRPVVRPAAPTQRRTRRPAPAAYVAETAELGRAANG